MLIRKSDRQAMCAAFQLARATIPIPAIEPRATGHPAFAALT
jgi:hypothetical protein